MPKHFTRSFFAMVIFYLFGFMCLIGKKNFVTPFVYRFSAAVIVCIGIVKLLISDYKVQKKQDFYLDFFEGLIDIFVGVICFNFYINLYVNIICGTLYFLLPIIRIFISENKKNQFIMDIPKFAFGLIIIVTYDKTLTFSKVLSGIILLSIATAFLIYRIIKFKRLKELRNGYEKS